MYVHGFTTADNILIDLDKALTTGVTGDEWTKVYPAESNISITNKVVFKVDTNFDRKWLYKETHTVPDASNGVCSVPLSSSKNVAFNGGTRIIVRDDSATVRKKYNLYLKPNAIQGDIPDVIEYYISPNGRDSIILNPAMAGKTIYVDYEEQLDTPITKTYYIALLKPNKITKASGTGDTPNHYQLQWVIGDSYSVPATGEDPETDCSFGFATDHHSIPSTLSWFRHTTESESITKGWLPIEYWISFDLNGAAGVIMGDPGLSKDYYLSSPFYLGRLDQIDGALNSDHIGNFAGFTGSFIEPPLYLDNGSYNPVYKTYGDYTGNGATDVIMAYSKSGRPYNMHKAAIFGAYEFREKTFNGQSAHTGKHAVSDIVIGDIHENDRGKLRRCLAVPRVGKDHGTELIYNRYVSGEEETYVFLHINAPYTPFNTSPDSLIGFAIRIDA